MIGGYKIENGNGEMEMSKSRQQIFGTVVEL